jgi:hypothetical protein
MEEVKPQIIDGTALTSRLSRQDRHNGQYLLPKCCQIYNQRATGLIRVGSALSLSIGSGQRFALEISSARSRPPEDGQLSRAASVSDENFVVAIEQETEERYPRVHGHDNIAQACDGFVLSVYDSLEVFGGFNSGRLFCTSVHRFLLCVSWLGRVGRYRPPQPYSCAHSRTGFYASVTL